MGGVAKVQDIIAGGGKLLSWIIGYNGLFIMMGAIVTWCAFVWEGWLWS